MGVILGITTFSRLELYPQYHFRHRLQWVFFNTMNQLYRTWSMGFRKE